jgi:hypothetical protein
MVKLTGLLLKVIDLKEISNILQLADVPSI